MAKNIIQGIRDSVFVRSSLLALATFLMIGYVLHKEIPDTQTFLIALPLISISSFLVGNFLWKNFNMNSHVLHFVTGALSYSIYLLILIFFKIAIEAPTLSVDGKNALYFGGLTLASQWVLKKYME